MTTTTMTVSCHYRTNQNWIDWMRSVLCLKWINVDDDDDGGDGGNVDCDAVGADMYAEYVYSAMVVVKRDYYDVVVGVAGDADCGACFEL